MRTVLYTRLYVQLTGLALARAFDPVVYAAIAAVLLFSGLEHTPALTMLLGHMPSALIAPHLLTAAGPPPPGACGGGAVTHC